MNQSQISDKLDDKPNTILESRISNQFGYLFLFKFDVLIDG